MIWAELAHGMCALFLTEEDKQRNYYVAIVYRTENCGGWAAQSIAGRLFQTGLKDESAAKKLIEQNIDIIQKSSERSNTRGWAAHAEYV